jgi:hypothetical protein
MSTTRIMAMRIMTSLIASALLFTACSRATPTLSKQSEDVEIMFIGLMVFHPTGNHYEVGILDKDATPAPDHQFSITVDGVKLPQGDIDRFKSLGNAWVLEVENKKIPSVIRPIMGPPPPPRTDDDPKNCSAFGWIIDLESPEFHGDTLDLKPGKLKPIIQLSDGELFTERKTDELQRKRGLAGLFRPFGFVADEIGLKVTLDNTQEEKEYLVLRVVGAGKDGVVFELKPDKHHTVAIENIYRGGTDDQPHVQYYYRLFNGISGIFGQFEFKKEGRLSGCSRVAKRDAPKPHVPTERCCPYICGQLLLGTRTDPLW